MTLQRRPLGRGRLVAAGSSVVVLVGCVLPWFRAGGSEGITALVGNAFEGPGILVFLAALATLALAALPYAAGDGPMAADRWWAYGIVAALAAVSLVARVAGIAGEGGFGTMLPDRAPGLWIAAVGVLGLLFAVAEIFGERRE